ncbi:sulfotransferase 6B1-like [Notothenia coriiceps]|uniref:Sulfotransferase n=1 Tax=Notothenia coriiceps TaxID=8208 RepID=A0A6I9NNJ8_9TELE|nr:PREDICTED: sulfotransferase 6B1-like [Notothenia coriiceps]
MNTNDFKSNVQSSLQRAKDMSDEEKLYRYKGVLYPQLLSPERNLKALENFKAREEDIVLVAYPKCAGVCMEKYLKDLSDGIRQISSFFGYTLTEAQVLQISDGSTFSAMKQSSANSHGALGDVIFRKGEVGDWKNHFTPEQSREMDAAFNKQLAGTRLGAKLNYQRHCQ